MKCPLCNNKSYKIIYYGLPHRFCENEKCNCMFGFWSNITQYLPYTGWFLKYEDGYLYALWKWLTIDLNE